MSALMGAVYFVIIMSWMALAMTTIYEHYSTKQRTRWRPIGKSPKESGEYLVTLYFKKSGEYIVSKAFYHSGIVWEVYEEVSDAELIAWLPLPVPYKENK